MSLSCSDEISINDLRAFCGSAAEKALVSAQKVRHPLMGNFFSVPGLLLADKNILRGRD
jgi:hypothetical protein